MMEQRKIHESSVRKLKAFRVDVSIKTTWIFIEIQLDNGSTGFGEATCFGYENEIAKLVDQLNANLVDHSAIGLAGLLKSVPKSAHNHPRLCLLSGLEQAFLDALARHEGNSIAELFGGSPRSHVPVYANINRGTLDRSAAGYVAQATKVLAAAEYTAIKIAPFDGLHWKKSSTEEASELISAGMERIAAVRDCLPSHVDLIIDCHGRFDPPMAKSIMSDLKEIDILWIEEPCHMAALSGEEQRSLRHAAHASDMMVGGGEEVETFDQFSTLLHKEGHDVLLPDLRFTGLFQGIEMLRLAVSKNVHASIHNPVGPVLDGISGQLAASIPSFYILERQVDESDLYGQIKTIEDSVTDGALRLPHAHGLGFVPNLAPASKLSYNLDQRPANFDGIPGAGPFS